MQDGQLVSTAWYRCEDCSECPCRVQCCRAKDLNKPKEIMLQKTLWEKRKQATANIMTERGIHLRLCRSIQVDMVSLPGAYTATEAKKAHNAGADFVKLFPCIGNAPAYLKALSAPLNHIRFLAVGGVNADNCAAFMNAGAYGVGVGGCLVNKEWVAQERYDLITAEARRFVENINIK